MVLDSNIVEYLNKLWNILLVNSDTDDTAVNINDFDNAIEDFENELLDSIYSSPDELEEANSYAYLLSATAIAKYSYHYWYDVSRDTNHPWYNVIYNSNKISNENSDRPFWKWVKKWVVKPCVDVCGFVLGGTSLGFSAPSGNFTLTANYNVAAGLTVGKKWSATIQ